MIVPIRLNFQILSITSLEFPKEGIDVDILLLLWVLIHSELYIKCVQKFPVKNCFSTVYSVPSF